MTSLRASACAGAVALCVGLAACGGDDKDGQRTTVTRTVTAAQTTPEGQGAPGVSSSQTPGQAQPSSTTGAPGTSTAPQTGTVAAEPTPGVATPGVANQGAAPGAIGTPTVAQAFVPFNSTSPWNTPVDTMAVHPESRRMIDEAELRIGVIDVPGATTVRTEFRRARDVRLFINTTKWTTPVVDETGGSPVRIVCRQIICGPYAGLTSVIMPPDAAPDPRFDGWLTVINRAQNVAYDFWRARRVGDAMSYQYIKRWDLSGPGFSPPVSVDPSQAVGARGSGLPLFAGLILPQELQAGRINHALAISLPGPAQRNYVQPASVTDGVGRVSALPEGARIRLRSDAEVGRLPGGTNRRSAEAVLEALKRYGAIVVDRSAVPTLYAQKNFNYRRLLADDAATDETLTDTTAPVSGEDVTTTRRRRVPRNTTLLFGNELQGITLDDFEVVGLPALLQDPPLAAEAQTTQTARPSTAVGSGTSTTGTYGGPAER